MTSNKKWHGTLTKLHMWSLVNPKATMEFEMPKFWKFSFGIVSNFINVLISLMSQTMSSIAPPSWLEMVSYSGATSSMTMFNKRNPWPWTHENKWRELSTINFFLLTPTGRLDSNSTYFVTRGLSRITLNPLVLLCCDSLHGRTLLFLCIYKPIEEVGSKRAPSTKCNNSCCRIWSGGSSHRLTLSRWFLRCQRQRKVGSSKPKGKGWSSLQESDF